MFLIFKMSFSWLFSFFLLLVLLGLYEFFKLIKTTLTSQTLTVVFIILFASEAFPTNENRLFFMLEALVFCVLTLFWWLKNILLTLNYPDKKPSTNPLLVAINSIFLFTPLLLITLMDNKNFIFLLFLIVWSADSFAYFLGKTFGKHKLAPNLSSGKTIEGVIGGLVGVLIITSAWMYYYNETSWEFLLLALVTGVFSVVGDLYESIYKREAGVKDSGNILPGHGGVLDRIDGLLASTPIFIIGSIFLQ